MYLGKKSEEFGAGDESRTRDLNLGKVALYQLSYSRINHSLRRVFGGARRSRTAVNGFAIRCMAALLSRRRLRSSWLQKLTKEVFGAGDESRTRDLNLGKVALYQLSYSRTPEARIGILHTRWFLSRKFWAKFSVFFALFYFVYGLHI